MRGGPCLCGDTHCPSCGPAQGNWKCPICFAWADDGCEHIDENGALYPEWEAEADAIAKAERETEERLAQDLKDEEALAEEYWRNQR